MATGTPSAPKPTWPAVRRPVRRLRGSGAFAAIATGRIDGQGRVLGGAVDAASGRVAWIDAPRFVTAIAYIAVGWVIVIALPEILDEIGAPPALLFLGGGLLYSVGAVVYARKRPDPWPRVFGFHELFHALVIAAAVVHFVAMAGWVIPSQGG